MAGLPFVPQRIKHGRKKLEKPELQLMEACCRNFECPAQTALDLANHRAKACGIPMRYAGVAWKTACNTYVSSFFLYSNLACV